MKQNIRRIVARFIADLRNKATWVLNTIHNLALLVVAGIVASVVGWSLEGYLGVNPAGQTPLVVVIPALAIGFGGIYGAVALRSYARSQPDSDSTPA